MSEERRKAIREKAPDFTAFVDGLRRVFGNVRVRYVRFADGETYGKPGERGVPLTRVQVRVLTRGRR